MESIDVEKVKKCSLFSQLKNRDIKSLLAKMECTILHSGDVLFAQGAESDCLYLLLSGSLLAVLEVASGREKVIGKITGIEVIGELGLLSGKERTLTIKALSECRLLKLGKEDFQKMAQKYPAIMSGLMASVVTRSQQTLQYLSEYTDFKRIMIIPANPSTVFTEFTNKLKQVVEVSQKTILLTAKHYQSDSPTNDHDLKQWLDSVEADRELVIYCADEEAALWNQICLERADNIYIIGDGLGAPQLSEFANKALAMKENYSEVKNYLVLLYPNEITQPKNTIRWLESGRFRQHYHIKIHQEESFQSLLRFITGEATGVVLSGGGAKGWAEVGAIKALLEEGITIDAIGGSSIGAVVGGAFELGFTYEKLWDGVKIATDTLADATALRSITWPIISLYSGESLTRQLHNAFGELCIEDLWMPYFCVSCNLNHSTEIINTKGLLWEALRGSVAIPGIFPPALKNGEMLVDGGILNNLPVDIMREVVGETGTVIAINISSSHDDNNRYQFPPALTLGESLLVRTGLKKHGYRFPSLIDMLVKALWLGASVKVKNNAAAANLLVRPDVKEFGMIEVGSRDDLIERGYKACKEQLHAWKNESGQP